MTETGAEARLVALGITLPAVGPSAGNYVPFVQSGNLLFISGQVPIGPSGPLTGRVGETVSEADAKAAARLAGLGILAVAKHALGTLDRVSRVVKLTGFVNAVPGFAGQPSVINGCSDLMVEVFGERGRHARAAVGAGSLPLNVSVEIDAVLEVRPGS